MLNNKHVNKIAVILVCLSLLFCGFIVYAANINTSYNTPEYQKRMFNGEVVSINIIADPTEWEDFLNNATQKEYISVDLVINGELFSTVGLRAKGNSSLTQMTRADTGRYSLNFNMDYYVKGQTYYGLDVFCVNNMTNDATYMKDNISYDIMRYIGVPTPLTSYGSISVNGELYAFGTLIERYDKAFLDRVYNTSAGYLYSVKIQMGQRDNFIQGQGNFEQPNQNLQTNNQMTNRGMGGMGGMGGSGGGSLIYSGDDISNYGAIFNNPVFASKTKDSDNQRVVTAIKNLNDGTDLDKYFDVDEILRYMAAHTVVVNLDSYSSNMQQNYYIYERDGRLAILPWDYNLAFGGFQSGNVSDIINFPIDTPVSGVSMEDRPLFNKLLEVDEYKERYHQYISDIVNGYFFSGLFENTVLELDAKINEYVKNDPTAFVTYEQYEASIPVFIQLGMLRGESIAGQLDGSIPSTSAGQRADSSSLIDAGGISLSALGLTGGGNRGNNMGEMPGNITFRQNNQGNAPQNQGNAPQNQGNRDNSQRLTPQMGGGNMGSTRAQEAAGVNWGGYAVLCVILTSAIMFMAMFKRRNWTRK